VDGLLGLLRLADSALPVGGYTLSHGLESYAADGAIETPEALAELLRVYLVDLLGPADGVACGAAWTAAADGDLATLAAIDRRLHALKLAREGREAATRGGRRLLALAPAWGAPPLLARYRELVVAGESSGIYAVVFGLAGQQLGVAREATVLALLHASAVGLLAAAQRLTRLDHERAQALLHDLGPTLRRATTDALAGDWRWLSSNAPEIEIMAMRHERLFVRLFAS
jgi:urease accessory protein